MLNENYLNHTKRKDNNIIVLSIIKNDSIEFLNTNTNEKKNKIATSEVLTLSRNTIYRIPIINQELSLDKNIVIKIPGELNEKIEILNIDKGFVFIQPRINIYTVFHGQEIGFLI